MPDVHAPTPAVSRSVRRSETPRAARLTPEQQLEALGRVRAQAEERVRLGVQLFKAAEAHTSRHRQLIDELRSEQQRVGQIVDARIESIRNYIDTQTQSLRDQIMQEHTALKEQVVHDVAKSLQGYDQWIGQIDEGFTKRLRDLENRLESLHTRWASTERKIGRMMRRAESLLDTSKSIVEKAEHFVPKPAETADANRTQSTAIVSETTPNDANEPVCSTPSDAPGAPHASADHDPSADQSAPRTARFRAEAPAPQQAVDHAPQRAHSPTQAADHDRPRATTASQHVDTESARDDDVDFATESIAAPPPTSSSTPADTHALAPAPQPTPTEDGDDPTGDQPPLRGQVSKRLRDSQPPTETQDATLSGTTDDTAQPALEDDLDDASPDAGLQSETAANDALAQIKPLEDRGPSVDRDPELYRRVLSMIRGTSPHVLDPDLGEERLTPDGQISDECFDDQHSPDEHDNENIPADLGDDDYKPRDNR